MKERYKIRHQILKALFDSASTEKNPQLPKNKLSNMEISKRTGIPIQKIDIYHEMLHEDNEVICTFNETNAIHAMVITSKGRQSYIDRKYIKEGRKYFWDTIYDPVKIILPLVSIVVSVFALNKNSVSSENIKELHNTVDILENKVDSLSAK